VSVSIEKRGKKWRVRQELGTDPATGKRISESKTVDTKRDAERLRAALLLTEGNVSEGSTFTLDQTVAAWLSRTDHAPTYRYDLLNAWTLVPENVKDARIRTLTTATLDAMYDRMSVDGISPWRIKRVHEIVRTALSTAVRYDWIARNPASYATPPKPRKKTPTPPAPEQVAELVDAAGPEIRLWLRIASTTALRRGEVAGLQWRDIADGRLWIRRAVAYAPGTGVHVKATKTDRDRRIAISDKLATELEQARREQIERCERLGATWDDGRYVFSANPTGLEPRRPDYATNVVGKLRDRLGLEGVRLKELRHYVATQLLAQGVDVKTVSSRMGHASTAMTTDVYASFLSETDRAAAELLD